MQAMQSKAPYCRAVGTGGARGARAPPIFWNKGTKSTLNFHLFAWLLSVVHPLILAVCYVPETEKLGQICNF